MCGIAGFITQEKLRSSQESIPLLEAMCRLIAHRGPDDQGTFVEGRAALGMRRLSIIDLVGGHQPMSGCDHQVTIVFNGEIYNYQELKKELEALGHRFKTHSDTETVVHAYEEFGNKCVDKLRGMFAFAIWDARKQSLFIARDRVGEKPFYYSMTRRGSLVFGSELKCLLEHPEVDREISPEALDAYFTFGYVCDPLTIFQGIQKLAPGHHLTLLDGRLTIEQYWDFPYEPIEVPSREEEYIEELRRLLDEAVRLQLVADVPLGAFLSGGVDSIQLLGPWHEPDRSPLKPFQSDFKRTASMN